MRLRPPYHVAMSTLASIAASFFCAVAVALPFNDLLDLPEPVEVRRASVMVALDPGDAYTLLDAEGPGCVTYIWMTTGAKDAEGLVLRMYWDDSESPSVEVPLTYFFGVGHDENAPPEPFAAACIAVAPQNGYNSYWPMPFQKRAHITVTNETGAPVVQGGGVYFQATYQRYDSLPSDTPAFHAVINRSAPAPRRAQPHTIVMTEGQGFIAGVTYHVGIRDRSDAWFHGGGDYIFLDGAASPNLLKGIGGEDFIGQSWHNARFTTPSGGCTVAEDDRVSMYRFFLEGPPLFRESARFAFGAMENEIASVGYWYQSPIAPGKIETVLEPSPVAIMGPFAGDETTATPLDGLHPMNLSAALQTNYTKPYRTLDALFERHAVRWESHRTVQHWLDLEAAFKPKMPQVVGVSHMPNTFAYVLLRLESDAATNAELGIGHDDGVRIWLNGDEMRAMEANNGFGLSTRALALVAGQNDVLLKVANGWNANFAAWAVSLVLEAPDSVRILPWPDLPEAPLYGTPATTIPAPAGPPAPPVENN